MAREELIHINPAELSDLLTGHTSEAREQEIRKHLKACGVCQAELALAESFHEQGTETPLAPAIAARLEAELRAWFEANARAGDALRRAAERPVLTPEERRQLEALGYAR